MKNNKINEGLNYTEDWLPIKQILNGMIQLENGEYVTGVKVSSQNIFIMEEGRRNNIIYNLRNFYNSINYEFWLIIADRPVDIDVYLSQLQILYNNSTDPVQRKLIMQDLNKANLFMSTSYNVVDIEYFIIFKEKKLELVQKKIYNLISGLANCGLNSMQMSNQDLRMMLDNFFNGGTQYKLGMVMS